MDAKVVKENSESPIYIVECCCCCENIGIMDVVIACPAFSDRLTRTTRMGKLDGKIAIVAGAYIVEGSNSIGGTTFKKENRDVKKH